MAQSSHPSRALKRELLSETTAPASELVIVSERFEYATQHSSEFVDITADVRAVIERSGVVVGQVLAASAHTTAAVTVQEHEPLLLRDMARVLDRIIPADDYYEHNDFTIRTDVPEGEPENGHSHCQHLLIGASETLPIQNGEVRLGVWQSIFLVELDFPPGRFEGEQLRSVTVQVMGLRGEAESG